MLEKDSNRITIQINVPEIVESLLPRLAALLDRFDDKSPQNQEQSLPDEIMTADDVCRDFKLNKTKLYSLTMQTGSGSIPRFKIGRDLRFKKSELLEWFNSQKV
ncbi:MAG: helix-turn-helix domain-containing protein [Desulfobacteraceae bacterium]|nr:helix-turn-helix domain-containing protein [Desulfobacteraceae bacterium]